MKLANHRGGRGDWVSPRVGNYSKPRVLKERGGFVDERPLVILHGMLCVEISFQTTDSSKPGVFRGLPAR